MNSRTLLVIAVIASVVFLSIMVPYIRDPALYSRTPEEFSTRFHDDPSVYQKTDLNATGSALLLMQDLLDITGPVTLNIRIHDPESAFEELSTYRDLLGRTEKLVVQIEMDRTELDQYLRAHKENQQILQEFLNQTKELDRLKQLEIQFADPGKEGEFTSLIFEESAIRKRLKLLEEQYRKNDRTIGTTSSRYGLNTTQYQESLTSMQEIIGREDREQKRVEKQTTSLPTPSVLILTVNPREGRYGDTLLFSGYYGNIFLQGESPVISIVIDSRDTKTAPPDERGRFTSNLSLGKVSPGTHTAYARYNNHVSNLLDFEVVTTGSVLTLNTTSRFGAAKVNLSGTLVTTTGAPVAAAQVRITDGKKLTKNVQTDAQGRFRTEWNLPGGEHTLKAVFSGTGYPIDPSESAPVTVMVDLPLLGDVIAVVEGRESPVPLLVFLAILGGTIAAAVWYIRRKNRDMRAVVPLPATRETRETPSPMAEDKAPVPGGETHSYGDKERSGTDGESVYQEYLSILTLLKSREPSLAARPVTPREVVAALHDRSFAQALSSWIGFYEILRYGPGPVAPHDLDRFFRMTSELEASVRSDGL